MGVRWLLDEWKPNMEELEASVVFEKENTQTKSDFFTGDGFQCDIVCWMFLH